MLFWLLIFNETIKMEPRKLKTEFGKNKTEDSIVP